MRILILFCVVVLPGCVGTLSIPGCKELKKPESVEEVGTTPGDEMLNKDVGDLDSEILHIDARSLREVLFDSDDIETRGFELVDVRDFDSYANCRIRGAINIPLKDLRIETLQWDRGRRIILYCGGADCVLAKRAARRLVRDGFLKVFVFGGGITEWISKGFELDGPCRNVDSTSISVEKEKSGQA